MKKRNKFFIGCGCFLIILIIGFIVAIFFMIGGHSEGKPSSVPYHNANDLKKITGVTFPQVTLVDSSYYDAFNISKVDMTFLVKGKKQQLKRSLDNACIKDSCCWSKNINNSEYYYYILPQRPIDRTKGTHKRMVKSVVNENEMVEDWDGDYIEVTIPFSLDTIYVSEGWAM